MPDIVHALQAGTVSLWLFIPTAILLGALHGLEPGHSKTMMAAFIIAIRGTFLQAILLGLSAALSHSLIIWLLAAAALHFGSQWNAETAEPYLQLASAAGILVLASWMFIRTRRELHGTYGHHHHHGHEHSHDAALRLDTGSGKLELSVFEDGVPPVFRLRAPLGEVLPAAASVTLETQREGLVRQSFAFRERGGFLESIDSIPEPHEFAVVLTSEENGRSWTARGEFTEDRHDDEHGHQHGHGEEFQDAHELEHAQEIERRFAGRRVTTSQIVLFGVTGGLMPCPAAFSVLLICLQLKRVALGFVLVGGFSFGLAVTMVTTGVLAAWSVRHAERKFKGFGEVMRRAPYISCALLVVLAAYMAWHGWRTLALH